MNQRERFIATLQFEQPDRIPFVPGDGRQSTLAAWHKQGLPEDVEDYHAYARQVLGLPKEVVSCESRIEIGVDFRLMPRFEEKVLEDRGRTWVVQDWKGNVCEISKEYDVNYLRDPIDFVTRSWLKCPVESREDWEAMKIRYDLGAPGRFKDDFHGRAAKLRDRTYPAELQISGPFWQLREWLGFESLCMLFLDDPGWLEEMIEFWEDFVAEMLQRLFEHHVPDIITFNEDMAYKSKPMIGPDMCRRFLLKTWKRWADLCHQAGVPVVEIDSDGHVGELIPVWIEAGVSCNSPLEVAAGNDLAAYHRQYGRRMAYRGGVDKRKMAKGGQAIRDEIDRLRPVIAGGGYIPSCDHGIPHDVSWPNFLDYCRLLGEATGWL